MGTEQDIALDILNYRVTIEVYQLIVIGIDTIIQESLIVVGKSLLIVPNLNAVEALPEIICRNFLGPRIIRTHYNFRSWVSPKYVPVYDGPSFLW